MIYNTESSLFQSFLKKTVRDEIVEAGAIPALVELLTNGAPGGRVAAARALSPLACSDANRVAMAEAGAIAPLVALLTNGAHGQDAAAEALATLAWYNDANQVAIREAGAIPPLVALATNGATRDDKMWAAAALRNLSWNAANLDAIREAGGVAPLAALLANGAYEEWVATLSRPSELDLATMASHTPGAEPSRPRGSGSGTPDDPVMFEDSPLDEEATAAPQTPSARSESVSSESSADARRRRRRGDAEIDSDDASDGPMPSLEVAH
jgi:hypothetical protein